MRRKSLLFSLILLVSAVTTSFTSCSNGIDGKDGTNGKDGKDGISIVWKGSYESTSNPALSNPEYMWAYYNTTDGCSYVWNGKAWTLLAGTPQTSFNIQITTPSINNTPIRTVEENKVVTKESLPLAFITGKNDIPYLPFFTQYIQAFLGTHYTVSDVSASTTKVTITNTARNTTAVFDLTKHTCTFDNYDAFFQDSVVYKDAATVTSIDYMKITNSDIIAGKPITVDWSANDIGIVLLRNNEDKFVLGIPLQTFNDVFLAPKQISIIYNGKYLYTSSDLLNNATLQNDYYTSGNSSGARSKAFAEFCYNELCLNFDFNYGLKAIHGIDAFPNFDTYFACIGIRDKLKSTNAQTFARALKDVCEFYFGDGHSNYQLNSHYLGNNITVIGEHTSPVENAYQENRKKYSLARNKKIGTGSINKIDPVYGYGVSTYDYETAIVRFDSFTRFPTTLQKADILTAAAYFSDNIINAYAGGIITINGEPTPIENIFDTVIFIHAINKKIKANSNIKNIILDLSCNSGGANHSAAFVLAWLLGECTFNFTNPITGAKWYATYKADVNMDGVYDENDTVNDKNLFCLISPLSFSCANMVPAMLKASDRITILGATSGGGTSVIQSASAADGTLFRMSSKYVMSIAKNGSTYNIDTGIEPHYFINNAENFYDSATLAKLVDAINKAKMGGSIF